MSETRVVPWSHVRHFHARAYGRSWIVVAGLVDGTVKLPGTDGGPDRTKQHADVTAVNPGEQWLAIGLDLALVTTAEGGRQTPLLVTEPLRYRPTGDYPA